MLIVIKQFFIGIVSCLFLVYELFYNISKTIINKIEFNRYIEDLNHIIQKQNRYIVLILFLLPLAAMEYLHAMELYYLWNGMLFLAVMFFILSKLVGFIPMIFIYKNNEDKVMSFYIVNKIITFLVFCKNYIHNWITSLEIYHIIKAYVKEYVLKLKCTYINYKLSFKLWYTEWRTK